MQRNNFIMQSLFKPAIPNIIAGAFTGMVLGFAAGAAATWYMGGIGALPGMWIGLVAAIAILTFQGGVAGLALKILLDLDIRHLFTPRTKKHQDETRLEPVGPRKLRRIDSTSGIHDGLGTLPVLTSPANMVASATPVPAIPTPTVPVATPKYSESFLAMNKERTELQNEIGDLLNTHVGKTNRHVISWFVKMSQPLQDIWNASLLKDFIQTTIPSFNNNDLTQKSARYLDIVTDDNFRREYKIYHVDQEIEENKRAAVVQKEIIDHEERRDALLGGLGLTANH